MKLSKKQNVKSCQTKIPGVTDLIQLFYVMKEDWSKLCKPCPRDRYLTYVTIKVAAQDSL